jgi:hypothetical protein
MICQNHLSALLRILLRYDVGDLHLYMSSEFFNWWLVGFNLSIPPVRFVGCAANQRKTTCRVNLIWTAEESMHCPVILCCSGQSQAQESIGEFSDWKKVAGIDKEWRSDVVQYKCLTKLALSFVEHQIIRPSKPSRSACI